jgi:hypothetical protein
MYARFGSGAQSGAPERECCSNSNQGSPVPPGGRADSPPMPVMQSEEHQHQHQHQHSREGHDVLQIPDPFPPTPTNKSLPETPNRMSPGQTVERLARKLSKQYLQQGGSNDGQLQTQPTPLPLYSATVPQNPWQAVGEPIEVDEAYCEPDNDPSLSDVRGPRSQIRGGSSTRNLSCRLEDMISSGTQCNVRGQLPSIPTPSRPTPGRVPPSEPGPIEADPDCAMPGPDLEVDDAEGDGLTENPEDVLAMLERGVSLRDASGPGGVRKHMVGGIALQYRLSADVALRCQNVVHNRPRMRRRHKTRHRSSAASSAVTSAVNSPVMPSAPSPSLPPTHSHPA